MTRHIQNLKAAADAASPAPKPFGAGLYLEKTTASDKATEVQISPSGLRFPASPVIATAGALALALILCLPIRGADDHLDRPIKHWVPPAYPEMARRLRVSGVVRVAATVAPDGSVTSTKTVSGNHILAGAAEEAVLRWKFGTGPSESTVEVDVNFALTQ